MLRVCVLVRNVLLSKATGFKIVSTARVTTFTEFLIPLRFLPIDRRSCKIYADIRAYLYNLISYGEYNLHLGK